MRLSEGVGAGLLLASAPERPRRFNCACGSGPDALSALRRLRPGARSKMDGPFGDFIVPAGISANHVFGGDTGIAPIRSIVLHLVATDDPRGRTVLYEPDGATILYPGTSTPWPSRRKIVYESGDVAALVRRHQSKIPSSVLMIAGSIHSWNALAMRSSGPAPPWTAPSLKASASSKNRN